MGVFKSLALKAVSEVCNLFQGLFTFTVRYPSGQLESAWGDFSLYYTLELTISNFKIDILQELAEISSIINSGRMNIADI